MSKHTTTSSPFGFLTHVVVMVAISCLIGSPIEAGSTTTLTKEHLEDCIEDASRQLAAMWIPRELVWLETNYDFDSSEEKPLEYYTNLIGSEFSKQPEIFENFTEEVEDIVDDTDCGTGFLDYYRDEYPDAYANYESKHPDMVRKIKLSRAANSYKLSVLDSYS